MVWSRTESIMQKVTIKKGCSILMMAKKAT